MVLSFCREREGGEGGREGERKGIRKEGRRERERERREREKEGVGEREKESTTVRALWRTTRCRTHPLQLMSEEQSMLIVVHKL